MSPQNPYKLVRSPDGWFAGVCKGISQSLDLEVWVVRLFFVLGFIWFGTGILVYILAAISWPRSDRLENALEKKVLGVCRNIAIRSNTEIGLVRFLACLFAFSSFGLAILVYFLIYVSMPRESETISKRVQ